MSSGNGGTNEERGTPGAGGRSGSWADGEAGTSERWQPSQPLRAGGYGNVPAPYGGGAYGQPAQPSWGYTQPGLQSPPSWGSYGQQGPASQGAYRQPGHPSWGPYGQSAPVSGPGWGYAPPSAPGWQAGAPMYGGYGQPAPSSQAWHGAGTDGSWWSGYGAGPYGQEMGRGPETLHVRGRSSRARLWLLLGVVAALLVVAAAGAGYVIFDMLTPSNAVSTFCNDLRSGRYVDAYGMLGSGPQREVTATGFTQAQVTLDRVEGGIVQCGVDSGVASSAYHPGDNAATLGIYIEWASAGKLTGTAQLKNNGGWKLETLDSSVFGVNLGALSAATAYCEAMQDQNYPAAYDAMSSKQQTQVKSGDYAQLAQWQDQIDGAVTSCQVTNLGTGNTASAATLSVTMKRTKLGQRQDTVALAVEGDAWKITSIGAQLQGTDVGAIPVALRFCSDIGSGNYRDLWTLLSDAFKSGGSEAQLASVFNGQYNGIKFVNCTPDSSTLKVKGASATIDAQLTVERLADGATAQGTVTLSFIKSGSAWKLNNLTAKK